MEYLQIDGIKKPISRIAFGCAIAPMIAGENVHELLDACVEMGITTFDTAENYGLSELSLGNWMRDRKNRDNLVIISKGCHPYNGIDRVNPEALIKDIEQSFERLGTDYIDIYFLHRDDLKIEVGPMVEILNDYHRRGKIGAFGGSNWTHKRIEEANQYAKMHGLTPFKVSSPYFGLADQIQDPFGGGAGCVSIAGPSNEEARNWYVQNDIPIFAYSSLGRGFFSGKITSNNLADVADLLDEFAVKGYCYEENYERLRRVELLAKKKQCSISQIALAWTLSQELKTVLLVSSGKIERMRENLKAFEIDLTEEEMKWLNLYDE